jgi:lipoprotein-releasing system ATP-binding protein
MSALLEARNVSRTLPGPPPVTIIEDASASFGKGELVAVTGPSGSGKSSLLYLLGLLDRPSSGTVQVEGCPTSTMGRRELARLRLQRFGFVFQFHFLLPEFTALDNVLIPMRKLGALEPRPMRARAQEILASLGLADDQAKYPEQLSGGMRQRVAIARTLAVKPQVILMDEPFGALDVQIRLGMQNLINELWEEIDATILFVTHDIPEAVYLADKIHILSAGPGTFVDEVEVDLPVHRTEELKQSKRFRELETLVLERIRAQAKGGSVRITT